MKSVLLSIILALGIFVTVSADEMAEYSSMSTQLSSMIEGSSLTPQQIMIGGWVGFKYYKYSDGYLKFNRTQFVTTNSLGRATISGIYLALNGTAKDRLLVRRELETNHQKRLWLLWNYGTEDVFLRNLNEGVKYQSLLSVFPSPEGLRFQCRLLMQSSDALTRRAGLFWGFWVADKIYYQAVKKMVSSDSDLVNRNCAGRLLEVLK